MALRVDGLLYPQQLISSGKKDPGRYNGDMVSNDTQSRDAMTGVRKENLVLHLRELPLSL